MKVVYDLRNYSTLERFESNSLLKIVMKCYDFNKTDEIEIFRTVKGDEPYLIKSERTIFKGKVEEL